MTPRRLYAPVVLGTLATGGLAFFALARTWGSVRVASGGLPSDAVAVSGTDAYPVASALSLVIVTSALAILAASSRIRRAVGVLVILVSVGAVVVILDGRDGLDDALAAAVRESPAFTSGNPLAGASTTPWNLAALAAFALASFLGAVTVRFGPAWPTMSSRYDAPAVRRPVTEELSDSDMWKAMDDGRDPTQ